MQSMATAWIYSTISGDGHQGVWAKEVKDCSQSEPVGLVAAKKSCGLPEEPGSTQRW